MRLSQVLVIAVASFLFASDTVAVTTSNQAKISKAVQSSPSQRLLRSNKYPVKEEEDESEDSVDVTEFATPDEEALEERTPLSKTVVQKLDKIAKGWDTTFERVAMGRSGISQAKIDALLAMRDAYVSGVKKEKDLAKGLILAANNS